jgi:hypothetical protein
METLQKRHGLSIENLVKLIHLDKAIEKSKTGKLGRGCYSEKTKSEVLKFLRSSNESAFHLGKFLGVPVGTLYRCKSVRLANSPKFMELSRGKDNEKSTPKSPVSLHNLNPTVTEKAKSDTRFSADSSRQAEIELMFGFKIGVDFIDGNKFNIVYVKLGKS